jgi:phage terminase small subunit
MKKTKSPKRAKLPKPPTPAEPRVYSFTAHVIDPETGKPYQYTAKEIEFINAYMTDPRHIATDAAKAAGFQSKSAGGMRVIASVVMARTRVRSAINQAFEALAMPKMEILFRLARIAGGSVADILDENNELDLDLAKERGTDMLIRKIERRRDVVEVKATTAAIPGGPDNEPETELIERSIIKETVKFEIHDPLRALDMLGRNAKLFVDRHEHTGKDGKPIDINGPAPQVVLYLPDNGRQASADGDPPHKTSKVIKTIPGTAKSPKPANPPAVKPVPTPNPAPRTRADADPPVKRSPKRRTM